MKADTRPRRTWSELAKFESGFRSHWHSNAAPQLIWPTDSSLLLHLRDGVCHLSPGRAYWLPSGHEHRIEAPSSVSLLSLYWRPEYVGQLGVAGCVAPSALLREMLNTLAAGSLRDEAFDRLAMACPDHINPGSMLVLQHKYRSRHVEALAASWQTRPDDERGLAAWAKHLGVSTRTLTRALKAETGLGFSAFRRAFRIALAAEALGRRPTKALAHELGFSSETAFSKAFRQTIGMTPAAYRRRYFRPH